MVTPSLPHVIDEVVLHQVSFRVFLLHNTEFPIRQTNGVQHVMIDEEQGVLAINRIPLSI